MRPHTLKLRGLRSYLVEQTVDFTELELVAIIGPTGAGKSSLLEAMTYALYGGCTWDQRGAKALIADTAKTMTVQLTFEAAGDVWEVTRTTSRGAYPPPSHSLICRSNADIAKVDGEDPVNSRIEALIGLDFASFSSCVLLPQGRFEALLKAKPARRAQILEHIFGVEELSELRDRVDAVRTTVSDRREEIMERRVAFRASPAQEAAAAKQLLDELTPKLESMEHDVEQVARLRDQVVELRSTSQRRRERATSLQASVDGLAERLERIAARAVALGEARETLANSRARAAADLASACADEEAAAQEQRDEASITAAASTLSAARDELADILSGQDGLSAEVDLLEQRRTAHDEQGRAIEALTEELRNAREQEAEVNAELASVNAELSSAEERRKDLAELLEGQRDAIEQAESASRRLEAARNDAETSAQHLQRLAEEVARARARRDGAIQANAVAHVAADCGPGDACPICERALPDSFAPPAEADLDEANAQLTDGERAFADAQAAVGIKRGEETVAENALQDAQRKCSALEEALAPRVENIRSALALQGSDGPGLLAGLADIVATYAKRSGTLQSTLEARAGDASRLESRLEELNDEHVKESAALSERARAIAEQRDELNRRLTAIPSRLGQLPSWLRGDGMTIEALDASVATAETALEAAIELRKRRETATGAVEAAEQAVRDHDELVRSDVREPAVGLRASLVLVSRELERDCVDVPAAPEASGLIAELAGWARQITSEVDGHVRALLSAASESEEEAKRVEEESAKTIERYGATDLRDFERRLSTLRSEAMGAEREQRAAAAQIEPVTQLDELKAKAVILETGLRGLYDILTRGRFIGHVIAKRQRALLALASGNLKKISGGRFGFTADFEIVDTRSGLPRKPETLSGGETFQASLALALGLVELMGRAGGQLRALFLDEGFGSLDTNALDEALGALEARAAHGGQLIGVISHVPQVAERVPQVLEVQPFPDGAKVRLLDAGERARLAATDADELVA